MFISGLQVSQQAEWEMSSVLCEGNRSIKWKTGKYVRSVKYRGNGSLYIVFHTADLKENLMRVMTELSLL